jgi:hypothetical protein
MPSSTESDVSCSSATRTVTEPSGFLTVSMIDQNEYQVTSGDNVESLHFLRFSRRQYEGMPH